MIPPVQAAPRSRNAAATRQAILASARRHFARESYEHVGLREIAGDAGVDPALVSRYFGSKEALFKEAVRDDDDDFLEGVERDQLPAHFAALLMDKHGSDPAEIDDKTEQLLIVLRSASSPKASQILREVIDEDILGPAAALIGGKDAEMRVTLCLALLMGSSILRSAMQLDPICSADPGELERRLVTLFETALA